MNQEAITDFIIIDDDPINNMICNKIIQMTIPPATVKTFTSPEDGLEHIRAAYSGNDTGKAILFLDINMPTLTGWEVLDKLSEYPEPVKNHVNIFMLSSSVDVQDRERADKHPLVSGYITKPLSRGKLQDIFH